MRECLVKRTIEELEPRTLLVGAVSGFVFNDTNNNGQFETGDPPVSGQTVYVDLNNDSALSGGEPSAVSAIDGSYKVEGVPAGTRPVRVAPAANWVQTFPAANAPQMITFTDGLVTIGVRFGVRDTQATALFGARTFDDKNGNGVWDTSTEPVLSGRTVYIDSDNDGTLDSGEPSAITDNTGLVSFVVNLPGTYRLRQVLPAGWAQTAPANNAPVTFVVDRTGIGFTPQNFGSQFLWGTVTGRVFDDSNGNGVNNFDLGIPGRTVYIDLNANGSLDSGEPQTVTTNAGYSLVCPPGNQVVRTTAVPTGWIATSPQSRTVSVAAGATVSGQDFGQFKLAGINVLIWHDVNRNGRRDTDEPGIPGVPVQLSGTTPTTYATDARGVVKFTGVTAGSPTVTTPNTTAWFGDGGSYGTLIRSGDEFYIAWGYRSQPQLRARTIRQFTGGGVSGFPFAEMYVDLNNNAVPDGNDLRLRSDALGWANFWLPPGDYVLRSIVPNGYTMTEPLSGAIPFTASATEESQALMAFWYFAANPPTVSGFDGTLFEDRNNNARQDAEDVPAAGLLVYIDANNNAQPDAGERSMTTNASGYFWFADTGNVVSRVRAVLPPGWIPTFPSSGVITIDNNLNPGTGILTMGAFNSAPPRISATWFSLTGDQPYLSFRFSKDVFGTLDPSDWTITNLATNQPVPTGELTYDPNTRTGQLAIDPTAVASGVLADLDFRVALARTAVADLAGVQMADDFANNVSALPADANHDRRVDEADQAILTAHLGQSGVGASLGDFNNDGIVDAADQTILTDHWRIWLPARAPVLLPSTSGDDRYRLRPESAVLFDVFTGGAPTPTHRVVTSAASAVQFNAGAGFDTLDIEGTSNADSATFETGNIAMTSISPIQHSDVERITFDGEGGADALSIGAGATVALVAAARLQSLSIAPGGTLDVVDQSLIVDYTGASQLNAVQLLINSARAGGTWLGTGITSSAARQASPHNRTLGAMEASDYKSIYPAATTFAGHPIDDTAVLVKYTYYGDTDFNGAVNFDDYSRTDVGFNFGRTGWLNGDFDGNGVVNFDDYSLIDLAFNSQEAAVSPHVRPAVVRTGQALRK